MMRERNRNGREKVSREFGKGMKLEPLQVSLTPSSWWERDLIIDAPLSHFYLLLINNHSNLLNDGCENIYKRESWVNILWWSNIFSSFQILRSLSRMLKFSSGWWRKEIPASGGPNDDLSLSLSICRKQEREREREEKVYVKWWIDGLTYLITHPFLDMKWLQSSFQP